MRQILLGGWSAFNMKTFFNVEVLFACGEITSSSLMFMIRLQKFYNEFDAKILGNFHC
jgi:hypothetical protein